jgi:uncharacterized membrane-anchored protein
MWFFVLMTSIELFIIKNKLEWINDIYNFVMAIAFFVILNQIYLILNKRKDKILSLNTIISEKKERYYWIFLTILFFISFILAGYFGYLRKEYFG